MPGDNCSIYGCGTSRSKKYKGVGIFKVPSGEDPFNTKWREQLIHVVTRNRVIDANLRSQINAKRIFICQRHFTDEQINANEDPSEFLQLNSFFDFFLFATIV